MHNYVVARQRSFSRSNDTSTRLQRVYINAYRYEKRRSISIIERCNIRICSSDKKREQYEENLYLDHYHH